MNPFKPPQDTPPPPPTGVRVETPFLKPYATYTLMAVTVVVFLLQNLGLTAFITNLGDKSNQLIRAGQLWRLVSPLFLHASFLHIGFNMYALWIFGRGLESRFGRLRFLALYFLAGFSGNVLSFVLTPSPSLGASTAVFGLLAAEAVFLYQNRKLLHGQARSAISNLVFMAGINLLIGFSVRGVDNWGHIGGMIGGFLFAWYGAPFWKVEGLLPDLRVVDEREGRGLVAGSLAVLLMFIPVAILGWIWPVK